MSHDHCIFIGKTSSLPPQPKDKEHEIIYCTNEFDTVEDNDLDKVDFEYLVIVLYKTIKYVDSEIEYIKSEWKELTNDEITVEFLESDKNKITRGIREIFDEHDENVVIFKSPFVGFMKSSDKAYKDAKELVKSACLKPVWMFWK
ncbi:MAG TPA: hypothetical protein VKN14_14745 [Flavobacteriaceae bacterium]|nr:hypothetical protein [Flavobacteriaceae bacterium]